MSKTAFIGLGVMGFPMAGFLARAGHRTTVYNRTAAKAEAWAATYAGATAATPALAAQDADFVFACVGNDDDLREVTIGPNGAFNAMKPGAIFVDHTTTSASVVRELYAEAQKRGLHFLDAPVSGGQTGAEKGILTIMVGGDAEIYAKAEPLMKHYAKAVQHMGPNGSGALTKMVNQICFVGTIQTLAEALAFGQKAGLDMTKVIPAIKGGAAGSWQLETRGPTMIEDKFDFGFAVDWMRKDLGICMDEAKRNGANLTVTKLIDQYYSEVQQMGGGRWDTSSLIRRLTK